MTFKRARSKEQFEQRENDIIDAAIKIYKEYGFEDVTFSKISEITNFTRPTIYNYFSSKEEILLKMQLIYLEKFIKNIEDNINELKDKSIKNIASILTNAFIDVPEFMDLYAILYSVIEKKVSLEALAEFKKSAIQLQNPFNNALKKVFPNKSDCDLYSFLLFYLSFASGLYHMAKATPKQLEAISLSETGYSPPNFKEVFENTLMIYLTDLSK